MYPQECFAYYKKPFWPVLCHKRIGIPCCTLFTVVVTCPLQIILLSNYLLPTISVLAENTLLKTTCHFLLLLVGFDTLIERTTIDPLYLWVITRETSSTSIRLLITNLISLQFTLFAICLPFSSPPLYKNLPFFSFAVFLSDMFLSAIFVTILVVMDSSSSIACTPENDVLNFKQRGGDNLKDAWYRI